jgi:hypothetical protein
MCQFVERLFPAIKNKFENNRRLKQKFNIMMKKDNNYSIGSVNIEAKENFIDYIFDEVVLIAEEAINNLKCEVQKFILERGENIDLGLKQAEILKGLIYEIYCYSCNSVIFLRILTEKALFIDKRWISVDCDELRETLWFKE